MFVFLLSCDGNERSSNFSALVPSCGVKLIGLLWSVEALSQLYGGSPRFEFFNKIN